jgi:hypothetical protein
MTKHITAVVTIPAGVSTTDIHRVLSAQLPSNVDDLEVKRVSKTHAHLSLVSDEDVTDILLASEFPVEDLMVS